MSEYLHVEKPFLDQLATLGWTVIDQAQGFIPSDPAASLRDNFRQWLRPEDFRAAERAQERLIQGLLASATLLDVLRTCTVFMDTDSGRRVKVVCRYQQYRAAHRITQRLRSGKIADERLGEAVTPRARGRR